MTVGDHHLGRDEKSQIDVEVMKIFVHQDYDHGKITITNWPLCTDIVYSGQGSRGFGNR